MAQDDKLFAIVGCIVLALTATGFLVIGLGGQQLAPSVTEAPPALPEVTSRPAQPAAAVAESDYVLAENASTVQAVAEAVDGTPTGGNELAALVNEEDVTGWIARVVDQLAVGRIPGELEPIIADAPVVVRADDAGRMVLAAGTYRRYQRLANAIKSLDVQGAARWIEVFEADLDEAVADGNQFRERLQSVIAQLSAVELPDSPPEMESHVTHWAFADDAYQDLNALQQALLLINRSEAEAIQDKVEALRVAMDLPEPAATEPVLIAEVEGESPETEASSSSTQPASWHDAGRVEATAAAQ